VSQTGYTVTPVKHPPLPTENIAVTSPCVATGRGGTGNYTVYYLHIFCIVPCVLGTMYCYFVLYTRRYGALRAPSSSFCGGLLKAAFGCNLRTFGPNLFVVALTNFSDQKILFGKRGKIFYRQNYSSGKNIFFLRQIFFGRDYFLGAHPDRFLSFGPQTTVLHCTAM
jgi:hypothetical protein